METKETIAFDNSMNKLEVYINDLAQLLTSVLREQEIIYVYDNWHGAVVDEHQETLESHVQQFIDQKLYP